MLKERGSQLLAQRGTASKSESGWRTRAKKLLDELQAARGQRGTKRTAPEPVQDASVLEDIWCNREAGTGNPPLQNGPPGDPPPPSRYSGPKTT